MEIVWLGHAAFKIIADSGKVIYLDPYQLKDVKEKADIIISSHNHGDHFSRSDIKKIMKEDTILLGPESISDDLKKLNGKGLKIGEKHEFDGISITLVPAYTIKKSTHPKSNQWSGALIELEGKKIYHAGDTERIPEMKNLAKEKIDVAFLPCGGIYTMDIEESCAAAVDINPEIVVPMHNWDKNVDEYGKVLSKMNPNIKVEVLKDKTLKL